ncbi:MAG: aspartate kinase, partial [Euryarchaeota archaeon]|nr:aspartate kinase [Euryarchaeota archaeon]
MIKVMKFGGTSLGSAGALERSVKIVCGEKATKVVVVSAQSGVTNTLIGWMRDEGAKPQDVSDELRGRHLSAVENRLSEGDFTAYTSQIDASLEQLAPHLERYKRSDDPSLPDTIASWGERLSTITMSCLLRAEGLDAVPMTSEEAGIVATGPPGNGSADLDPTGRNLKGTVIPLLDSGKTPVLTGYYGCTREGRPLTFGRGGSDYSASIVAHGLGVDCLEIWTDVDGFMTADPRIVQNAKTIQEMDYGEAGELAYFGAKVLHPRTIEPVRRKKIRLLVKNTFNPDGAGTMIHNLRSPGKTLLRSVAIKSDLSIVKLYSSEIVYRPRFVSNLLDAIGDNGVNTYAVS